jgi:hypothetical protein
MRKTAIITSAVIGGLIAAGSTGYAGATLASHATSPAAVASPAPSHRVTAAPARKQANPVPQPTRTIYVTPPAPQQQTAQPAQPAVTYPSPDGPCPGNWSPGCTPAPVPAAPQLTNGVSVVLQFYQDLSARDYQAAWNLGGSNLNGGVGYDSWVAGYATTASISVTGYGTWSDGTVWTHISAVQTDGSVRTYDGTYTVAGGVIVSAHMSRTS